MARTTSRRVKPDAARIPRGRTGGSVRRGRLPQAPEREVLGAEAVLPGDGDFEVAERDVGLEIELLLVDTVVRPGVAHQDLDVAPVRVVALLAVVLDLALEEELIHRGARVQHAAGLPGGAFLEAQAAAEDLEAGDHPHPEDGERDRNLEQREALGPRHAPPHLTRCRPSPTRNRAWGRAGCASGSAGGRSGWPPRSRRRS